MGGLQLRPREQKKGSILGCKLVKTTPRSDPDPASANRIRVRKRPQVSSGKRVCSCHNNLGRVRTHCVSVLQRLRHSVSMCARSSTRKAFPSACCGFGPNGDKRWSWRSASRGKRAGDMGGALDHIVTKEPIRAVWSSTA
eukprot:scaffold182166_cov35-Tisochrysis_lutea.AAC.1